MCVCVCVCVRASTEEFDKASNTWKEVHRIHNTHTPEPNVTVGQLVSGRYYFFQVAAVKEVGEGPYSARFPQGGLGFLVGHSIVTIRPADENLHAHYVLTDLNTCDAQEVAGTDLTNRAPNWLAWHVRLTISELPRNQEPAASVEFAAENGTFFTCLNFKVDPNNSYSSTCSIPCQESRFSNTLAVTVWDSNHITKIAEGQLRHEARSKLTCGAFTPSSPLLCDVENPRKRRCMAATAINGSACDSCFDEASPQTYRVESRLCTGPQCLANERWCPTGGKGCLSTSCDACYTGSLDSPSDTGIICALPCELHMDLENLIVENRADYTLPPNSSVNIACDAGFGPIWNDALAGPGLSVMEFTCPTGNTQLEYRLSELPQIPICKRGCSAGGFQDVDGHAYMYIESIHGQRMSFTCDSTRFVSGVVVLECKDGVVEMISRTCQAGSCHEFGLFMSM